MVMYLGHVVEIGSTEQVFSPPYHPYTEALLLSAVPIADTKVQEAEHRAGGRYPLGHEPAVRLPLPDTLPLEKGRGGRSLRKRRCRPCVTIDDGHQVKCHLSREILNKMEPVIVVDAAE
jgi:peptide/nickel transport system ATP-binding protein